MRTTTTHVPPPAGTTTRVSIPVPANSETRLCQLGESELEALRRALAVALRQLPVGSPASQLLGDLSRRARAELRRRARAGEGPRAA